MEKIILCRQLNTLFAVCAMVCVSMTAAQFEEDPSSTGSGLQTQTEGMLQTDSEMSLYIDEQNPVSCEYEADEGCVATVIESLLKLKETISSSICDLEPLTSCATVEPSTTFDVGKLRMQLITLQDGVCHLERKKQELLEIFVSLRLKPSSIHLERLQTLHQKLVARSSQTVLLVATTLHDLVTELFKTALDQQATVQDLFQRSLLITEAADVSVKQIQATDLELNSSLALGLQVNWNLTTLLKQISNSVNITLNSTEGVLDNVQSTSLETVGVTDRISEYSEFFHASLHLLDQITEGISSVWMSTDNVTDMVDFYSNLEQKVINLDSEVTNMLNTYIDKLGGVAIDVAYIRYLVQESQEGMEQLSDLLNSLSSYKLNIYKVRNTLPAVIEHANQLHKQVQIILTLLDEYQIPTLVNVLETLDELDTLTANAMTILSNIPALNHIQTILPDDDDFLQDSHLLANDINTLLATSDELQFRASQMTVRARDLNSTLYNVSGSKTYTQLEEGLDRATKDQALVSQCLDETTALVTRANERVIESVSRVENITCKIPLTNSSDNTTLEQASLNMREASQLITDISTPLIVVISENHVIGQLVELTNESLDSVESEMIITASVLDSTDTILLDTYNYFDQVSLPVQFNNDTVVTLNSSLRGEDQFREVSFTMKSTQTHNCIVVHMISFLEEAGYMMSLMVGIQNGRLLASFVFTQSSVEVLSVNLTITEVEINAGECYLVKVTRTDRIVRLFLHNLDTEESYSTSSLFSRGEYSLFRKLQSERVSLFIGGTLAPSSDLLDTLFSDSMNYSGCISNVIVNGIMVDIWTAAFMSSNNKLLYPCDSLASFVLKPLQIKCGGAEFGTGVVEEGSLLPLKIGFSTFQHNTLLLYADNIDEVSSLQVSLVYGYIVIRVESNGRRRTLTSRETYSRGSRQSIAISLSRSQRSLVLRSATEETSRGLQQIETSAVLNYSRVFVGGSPTSLGGGFSLDADNLTGCISVSSLALIQPTPLQCVLNQHITDCVLCTDQTVFSATFYGASYASFPQVTITAHFDISFNFITSFSNGLLLHAGVARDGNWFTIKLVDSRLQVLFGNQHLSGLSVHPTSTQLNDSKWHSVTLLRIESSLEVYIDGREAGNFPFGGLFPLGTLNSNINIGGLSPLARPSVLPGLPTTGFKGHITDVYILGKVYDFSTSTDLNFVNFDVCELNNTCDNSTDVCGFSGTSFAEYDLGRFEPNFSLGFQLRTVQTIAILMYIFSRRRTDAFAIQITNGKVGVYAKSDEPLDSAEVLLSSDTVISDGEWHSIVIEKSEKMISLMVDDVLVSETMNVPLLMRTNSELYIGGIPGDRRIPLPGTGVVTSTGFSGQLQSNFLPHSTLTGDIQCGSHVT